MLPILLAAVGVASNGTTRITSARVNYDRKEGFAYFSGGVTVEDPTYVLHADRAFVLTGATNELKRLVAIVAHLDEFLHLLIKGRERRKKRVLHRGRSTAQLLLNGRDRSIRD